MVTISASKGVYDSDPSLPCGCHSGGRCSMLVNALVSGGGGVCEILS